MWLQNIDSRDLVWKISGIRILRAFERQKQIPYGNDNKKCKSKGKSRGSCKSKRPRDSVAFLVNSITQV